VKSVLSKNENKATSKISSVDELELSNLSLFDRSLGEETENIF
jgi:hypothetical protein